MEGLGKGDQHCRLLKLIAERLNKDFDRTTKHDVERLVYSIETSDHSQWTKQDHKNTMKRFYK